MAKPTRTATAHKLPFQELSPLDFERLCLAPSLAVTWQTSVDRLSTPARRLLDRLAWLGPEPIPESLLEVPRDALIELATSSLVTRTAEAPTFTVHRLVQDVTRRARGGHTGRLTARVFFP